jgi:hypothetical protein
MERLLAHKEVRKLLSDEHFSVDGTLVVDRRGIVARLGLGSGVHPREWTGSGCGFDHLPGMLLFELDGAAVVES